MILPSLVNLFLGGVQHHVNGSEFTPLQTGRMSSCKFKFKGPCLVTKILLGCASHLHPVCNNHTSSTAQGGGGSFKNRKPIGEVGCCESGMAERSHWWTERCLRSPLFLSLSRLSTYLPTYLPINQSIYLSIYRSISLSLSLPSNYLSIYLSICLSVYLSIYLWQLMCRYWTALRYKSFYDVPCLKLQEALLPLPPWYWGSDWSRGFLFNVGMF